MGSREGAAEIFNTVEHPVNRASTILGSGDVNIFSQHDLLDDISLHNRDFAMGSVAG